MLDRYQNNLVPQGISAEMIAAQWGLSRTDLDELAVASHARAAAATESGIFAEEIIPITTAAGIISTDQGIRPGTNLEGLAALKTPFQEGGVVTAGNASQISDGAAALLITTSERAAELGLTPLARFHTFALAGVDPVIMLTGPIPATQKVLQRSGLSISDIGAFEVNEAFASVLGAWLKETGASHELTNINGGAMALGHPLGASGARVMTTLVHQMRRSGARYGLQSICEGGGMANATILELL
jgi:acetyl-CoA acyltransferase